MPTRLRKFKASKKALLILVLGVIIAGGLVFGVIHKFIKHTSTIPSSSPSTTTPTSSEKQGVSSDNPSSSTNSSSAKIPTSSTSSGPAPIIPSGSFVSNHRPTSQNPKETSVCNTSPGATCYIEFTKGGTTNKLDAQVADGTGAAYWYWDVNQAGFTAGSWRATAIASLNGQTKSATDPIVLEVQL